MNENKRYASSDEQSDFRNNHRIESKWVHSVFVSFKLCLQCLSSHKHNSQCSLLPSLQPHLVLLIFHQWFWGRKMIHRWERNPSSRAWWADYTSPWVSAFCWSTWPRPIQLYRKRSRLLSIIVSRVASKGIRSITLCISQSNAASRNSLVTSSRKNARVCRCIHVYIGHQRLMQWQLMR
jgi:hypothetical protein